MASFVYLAGTSSFPEDIRLFYYFLEMRVVRFLHYGMNEQLVSCEDVRKLCVVCLGVALQVVTTVLIFEKV